MGILGQDGVVFQKGYAIFVKLETNLITVSDMNGEGAPVVICWSNGDDKGLAPFLNTEADVFNFAQTIGNLIGCKPRRLENLPQPSYIFE